MRGLVYATLKEFEKCGLDSMVNLFAGWLRVDAYGRNRAMSQQGILDVPG
jgi:hypothetical protein